LTAALLPKYPKTKPDKIIIKAKIKENTRGFINTLGRNPKDKPLEKTPNLLSTKPNIKITTDDRSADITLKNTP